MAHEQARALVRLGHDVRVFVGEPGSGRARHARADTLHEGIQVHRIALEPEDYSPEFLNFLHPVVEGHFVDVLQAFAPDIMHGHNLLGLSAKLPLLARLHGAGTVCTLHDFWGFCLLNTAVRADGRSCDDITQCRLCLPQIHDGRDLHVPMRLRKDLIGLALDQVDRFVAPSNHVAQRYIQAGWSPATMEVIPNGIAVDRFHPALAVKPADAAVQITYAGYLGAHKGVATLIEALPALDALVSGKAPPALLQLAGEGPEAQTCRARIEALGLGDRVRFLGKVAPADMPGVYARSDIVVLPSIWDENQPVCLMEAMAAGLPVVASRKGGIPELVEHGGNGLMFAAGDHVDLAGQLARLVLDPALRRRAGQEGRRRVEAMSHDRQALQLVAVYDGIAGIRPKPPSRKLVQRRRIYAVAGDWRHGLVDEGRLLADDRHCARRFLPPEWIAECQAATGGIVPVGRLWSVLRRLNLAPVLPMPRWLAARLLSGKSHRSQASPGRAA